MDNTEASFIYDGIYAIRENDVSYLYGAGIDEILMIERGRKVYFLHQDGGNSVTMITDTEGNKVDSFTYTSYGEPDHTNPINPYYFTGRRLDEESGLYYYRFRYYHPEMGRFLEQDPIGILDNINLYSYVNNNPVDFIDPLGLQREKAPSRKDVIEKLRGQGWKGKDIRAFLNNAKNAGIKSIGKALGSEGVNALTNAISTIKSAISWYQEHGHANIGYTGAGPGRLVPGVNLGIQISKDGLFFYYGFGFGSRGGGSATLNIGTLPSEGTTITYTIRGGSGRGGFATGGFNMDGDPVGSAGLGFGVSRGHAVTANQTVQIIEFD